MGYPEHLHAALEQLQEHLLQSWELSLHDLRQENEALRLEIARQYEDRLQQEAQQQSLKEEVASLQTARLEAESEKIKELESELQNLRATHQETQEKEAEALRQLDQVKLQLETEGAQMAPLRVRLSELESELDGLRTAHQEIQEKHAEGGRQLELVKQQLELEKGQITPIQECNSRLESDLQELRATHHELQLREADGQRQLKSVREQLEVEAAQSSRLTLEIVDLKLEHEKQIARLRGLGDAPSGLNLPDLISEEKPADPTEELQRLAYQDQHTGLPNLNLARRYLSIELSKPEKMTVALAILQLEGWTELQELLPDEALQHQILSQFSQRTRTCIRAEDVLASGGGGEFWLIFPFASGGPLGLKSASEHAQRSVTRILETLKAPFEIDDHKLLLSLWGGLCVAQGPEEVGVLIRHSRLALESSQSKGSNRLAVFQPELEKPAKRRETIEPMLRQALNRDQFTLRFLPVVELKTGQIKGVEALVRWEHPTEGTWEPGQFLDAACASGVIVALGEWVMASVCELSRNFRSLYWFINLSHPELMQADLARRLTRSMEAAQLNRPDYIVVECQERDLARPYSRVAANLKEFRNWKIGLAADDFAFAQLALKGLDKRGIGFLKISSKLTQDLDQVPVRNLVKGGLMAAEAAGARVILKGIENQGLLDQALEVGCPWGQGHRLSGPLTWPELEERLKARHAFL